MIKTAALRFFDHFDIPLYLRVLKAKKQPKKAKKARVLSVKTIRPFNDGSIYIKDGE